MQVQCSSFIQRQLTRQAGAATLRVGESPAKKVLGRTLHKYLTEMKKKCEIALTAAQKFTDKPFRVRQLKRLHLLQAPERPSCK